MGQLLGEFAQAVAAAVVLEDGMQWIPDAAFGRLHARAAGLSRDDKEAATRDLAVLATQVHGHDGDRALPILEELVSLVRAVGGSDPARTLALSLRRTRSPATSRGP